MYTRNNNGPSALPYGILPCAGDLDDIMSLSRIRRERYSVMRVYCRNNSYTKLHIRSSLHCYYRGKHIGVLCDCGGEKILSLFSM